MEVSVKNDLVSMDILVSEVSAIFAKMMEFWQNDDFFMRKLKSAYDCIIIKVSVKMVD